jgi:hypothetical protein
LKKLPVSRVRARGFYGVTLLLNALVLLLLLGLGNDGKIYMRNILFSKIYAEKDLPAETAIDAKIQSHFKRDQNPSDYIRYINQDKLKDLIKIKDDPKADDWDLAIAIIRSLGNMSDGKICGLESLNKIVYDTERGMGCCSDYSKAWMFYAIYLGMNVREVNSLNHTTVEYFDRKTGQWHWIDPYNRIEIIGAQGQALSLQAIRAATLFDQLRYNRVAKGNADFDVENYEGYAPSQLSVLMWRLGTNFLDIDRWDSRLRKLGLPKSIRQTILLVTGVQPHWMILTTNALAAKFRALQLFLYGSFGLLAVVNALAFWTLISHRLRKPA